MKTVFLLAEGGSIWLIWRLLRAFQLPEKKVLLYALNPLILLELTGNLHFEAVMVFFLLLALWWLHRERWAWSAVAMGLSVATKLLPLLFLPLLIGKLGWRVSIRYFILVGITVLGLFFPLLNIELLNHFGESLHLYFQRFEFNGSIYYLLRWIGFQWKGYNLIGTIGPLLAILSGVGILAVAWRERKRSWSRLPEAMLWCICIYLLLATTVHPWYLSLPVLCCLFTQYRFPILWSGLVMLTYINYSYPAYHENLWVVGLEYLCVGGFFLLEQKNF